MIDIVKSGILSTQLINRMWKEMRNTCKTLVHAEV